MFTFYWQVFLLNVLFAPKALSVIFTEDFRTRVTWGSVVGAILFGAIPFIQGVLLLIVVLFYIVVISGFIVIKLCSLWYNIPKFLHKDVFPIREKRNRIDP
jgi:hypothetical protein